MRFSAEQKYSADLATVLSVYTAAATWDSLPEFSRVKIVEVLGVEGPSDHPVVRVRYRFTADLPSAARAVVNPDRLSWVQETSYDIASGRSDVRFLPDAYADKLKVAATATFTANGDETLRRVDGELKVRVLLVGGAVERAIVEGLTEHLAEEQKAIAALLAA